MNLCALYHLNIAKGERLKEFDLYNLLKGLDKIVEQNQKFDIDFAKMTAASANKEIPEYPEVNNQDRIAAALAIMRIDEIRNRKDIPLPTNQNKGLETLRNHLVISFGLPSMVHQNEQPEIYEAAMNANLKSTKSPFSFPYEIARGIPPRAQYFEDDWSFELFPAESKDSPVDPNRLEAARKFVEKADELRDRTAQNLAGYESKFPKRGER